MFAVGAIASRGGSGRLHRPDRRTHHHGRGLVVYALSSRQWPSRRALVTYCLCGAGLGIESTLALSTPPASRLVQVARARPRAGARHAWPSSAGFASDGVLAGSGELDLAVGWAARAWYLPPSLLACAPHPSPGAAGQPPTHNLSDSAVPVRPACQSAIRRVSFLLLSLTPHRRLRVTGAMAAMIEIFRGTGEHTAASAVCCGIR